MIFLPLTVCLWCLFPSQSVSTVTQQVQEIVKTKCVKWLRRPAHTCGKTSSESSSGVFQDQVQEPACFFGGERRQFIAPNLHPWRCSTSSWQNRETEEAKMQFQPCCGLSAGGHHACTQADNNGGEESAGGSYFAGWLAALKHFSFRTHLQVLICCLAPSVLQ